MKKPTIVMVVIALPILLSLAAASTPARQEVRAPEVEIVLLPRIAVEFTAEVDGKVVQSEVKTALGMLALPYNVHPTSKESTPPVGYQEVRTADAITVASRKLKATRLEWTPKQGAFTNLRARKITVWVSDEVASPAHRIDLVSPNLPIPQGTVKYEHLPLEPDPNGKGADRKRDLTTITGEWLGTEEVTVLGKPYPAFRYSLKSLNAEGTFDGTILVSEGTPGLIHELRGKAQRGKDVALVTQRVKDVAFEDPPKDLRHYPAALFAVRVPQGWKEAKSEGPDEALRLIPEGASDGKKRLLTVEVLPAKGKNERDWAVEKTKGAPEFGLAYDLKLGMGDLPTFSMDYWAASKGRVRSYSIGSVRDDKVYLLSHWQEGVSDRAYAGSKLLQEVIASWRWLRKKK